MLDVFVQWWSREPWSQKKFWTQAAMTDGVPGDPYSMVQTRYSRGGCLVGGISHP